VGLCTRWDRLLSKRAIRPILEHIARLVLPKSVAESSVGARQGAKTPASVNNLTPTQPHLVHNSTLIILCFKLITAIYFNYNINRAV